MKADRKYFNIEKAIEKTGWSRSKIMKLIKEGRLETYQPSGPHGEHMITQGQIDRCIEGDK